MAYKIFDRLPLESYLTDAVVRRVFFSHGPYFYDLKDVCSFFLPVTGLLALGGLPSSCIFYFEGTSLFSAFFKLVFSHISLGWLSAFRLLEVS